MKIVVICWLHNINIIASDLLFMFCSSTALSNFYSRVSINYKILLKQLNREVNYCKRLFIHLLKHK